MNLKTITAATEEPITLAEAKLHLRVDIDDDDSLIGGLISSARTYVEAFTRRAAASTTYELILDDFPHGYEIVIPKPPLESVTSIKYTDKDGVETTWESSKYVVHEDEPAVIVPAYSENYPTFTPYPKGAVKIRFVAGYKVSDENPDLVIPDAVKQAMFLLISDWYENRGELLQRGHIPKSIPVAVNNLLYPYKIFGW